MNMKMMRFASALTLVWASAAVPQPVPASMSPQQIEAATHGQLDLLILERGGCEGSCPRYKVTVRGNGTVQFEGNRDVKHTGARRKQVSQQEISELVKAIRDARFFSLRDSYRAIRDGCPVYVIDLPTVTTTVKSEGVTKTVRHDHGCRETSTTGRLGEVYPRALALLESRIDQILKTDEWVGPRR